MKIMTWRFGVMFALALLLGACRPQALGQPAPEPAAPAVPGDPNQTAPQPAAQPATQLAVPGEVAAPTGGPPTFPAETVTSGDLPLADPGADPGAAPGAEDALTQALRGISGVYQE